MLVNTNPAKYSDNLSEANNSTIVLPPQNTRSPEEIKKTLEESSLKVMSQAKPAAAPSQAAPSEPETFIKITGEEEEIIDIKGANRYEWANNAKNISSGRLIDCLQNFLEQIDALNAKANDCEKRKAPGEFTNIDIKLRADYSCKLGVVFDELKRRARLDPVKLYSQLNNEQKFEKMFELILKSSDSLKDAPLYEYKGKRFINEFVVSMARSVNAVYGEMYKKYSPALETMFEEYEKEVAGIYEKQNAEKNLDSMTKRAKYKELVDVTKAKYAAKIENIKKEYADKVYRLGIFYGRLVGAFYTEVFDKVCPKTPLSISYNAIKASTTLKVKAATPTVEGTVKTEAGSVTVKPQSQVSLEIDVTKLIDSIVMQLEDKKKCEMLKEYGMAKPMAMANINMSDKESFDRGFYEGFKEFTGAYVTILEK